MGILRRPGVTLFATSAFEATNPDSPITDTQRYSAEFNLRGDIVGFTGIDLEFSYYPDNALVTDNIVAYLYSRKGSDNWTNKENPIITIPITNYGSASGIRVESLSFNGFDIGFGRYRLGFVADPGGTDSFQGKLRGYHWK